MVVAACLLYPEGGFLQFVAMYLAKIELVSVHAYTNVTPCHDDALHSQCKGRVCMIDLTYIIMSLFLFYLSLSLPPSLPPTLSLSLSCR